MALGEQRSDGLGFDQFARLVQVVEDDGLRIDAEGMVDGRQQFAGMHRISQRC